MSVPGPASPGAGAGGPGLLSGRGRGGEHEAELLAAGGCAASWAWLPGPVAGAFDDERLRAGLAESSRRLCARGAQNSPRRARREAPLKFPSRHNCDNCGIFAEIRFVPWGAGSPPSPTSGFQFFYLAARITISEHAAHCVQVWQYFAVTNMLILRKAWPRMLSVCFVTKASVNEALSERLHISQEVCLEPTSTKQPVAPILAVAKKLGATVHL